MSMRLPHSNDATCLDCGYALRGLDRPRCPECGRPFNPNDPATYRGDLTPSWVRWARPPSAWSLALTLIVMLWILDDLSQQVTPSPLLCLAVPIVLGLLVEYLVRAAAYHEMCGRKPAVPNSASGTSRTRWAVLPLAAAVVILAAATVWPMTLRFGLSRSSFDRVVRGIEKGTHADMGPQWIGLYFVEGIETDGPGSVFFLTGMSISDGVGFLHGPMNGFGGGASRSIAPNWVAIEN